MSDLPNGTITLKIEVTDVYGVIGTSQITFHIALPPPPNWVDILLIIGILAGLTVGASIYVKKRRGRDVQTVLKAFHQPQPPPALKVPVPNTIAPPQTTRESIPSSQSSIKPGQDLIKGEPASRRTVIKNPSQIAPAKIPPVVDPLETKASPDQRATFKQTCTQCNAQLPVGSKWCNKCGTKLVAAKNPSEPREHQ